MSRELDVVLLLRQVRYLKAAMGTLLPRQAIEYLTERVAALPLQDDISDQEEFGGQFQ